MNEADQVSGSVPQLAAGPAETVDDALAPRSDAPDTARGMGAAATRLSQVRANAKAKIAQEIPLDEGERRRLLIRVIGGVFFILGIALLGTLLFKHEMQEMGGFFVTRLGGPGVMLGFFLTDSVLLPIPNDTFSILGWLGGLSLLEVTCWASAGSIIGGFVAYGIGYHFLRTSKTARRLLGSGDGKGTFEKMQKGGTTMLILAAITPLPWAMGCWAAGAIEMPLRTVLWVSSLRFFRVASYLWLFQLGFIAL